MKQIIIYSTPTCPYCKMAKEFFKKKNLAYTDFDVANDQAKAQEMIAKSGQLGVPVIVIDGQIITGFDQKKIEAALS